MIKPVYKLVCADFITLMLMLSNGHLMEKFMVVSKCFAFYNSFNVIEIAMLSMLYLNPSGIPNSYNEWFTVCNV